MAGPRFGSCIAPHTTSRATTAGQCRPRVPCQNQQRQEARCSPVCQAREQPHRHTVTTRLRDWLHIYGAQFSIILQQLRSCSSSTIDKLVLLLYSCSILNLVYSSSSTRDTYSHVYCVLVHGKINAPTQRACTGFRKFSKINSCIARPWRARADLTGYPPSPSLYMWKSSKKSKVDYS